MTRFCSGSGLKCGTDVVGFPNSSALASWMFAHSGSVQSDVAVLWDTRDLEVSRGRVSYTIVSNTSKFTGIYAQAGYDQLWVSSGYSGRLLGIQKELDAAIVHEAAGAPLPTGSERVSGITAQAAPLSDFEGLGLGGPGGSAPSLILLMLAGPTFPAAGIAISSLLVLSLVSGEKSRRLVSSLRSIGLLESAYWLSWWGASLPLVLLLALVTGGIMQSTGILLFANTDLSVLVAMLALMGSSTLSMALCCSSFISAQRSVNVVSFCKFALVVVLSICLQFPVTFSGHSAYAALWEPGTAAWELCLFAPWPVVHFGRLQTRIFNKIYLGSNGVVPGSGDDSSNGNGGGGGSGLGYAASDAWESVPLRNGGAGFPWTVHRRKEAGDGGLDSEADSDDDSSRADQLWGGHAPLTDIRGARARLTAAANNLHGAIKAAHRAQAGFRSRSDGSASAAAGGSASSTAATASSKLRGWGAGPTAATGFGADPSGAPAPSGGGSTAGGSASGYRFTWADLSTPSDPTQVYVSGLPTDYTDYSGSLDLWMMAALSAGYLLVAWYLSQVATGDLGAAQPFYFPLSPYYWGLAKLPASVEAGDTIAAIARASQDEHSVRVHKLTKSYKGANTALKEVTLSLPPNQLCALLGHNGSGKTTLISTLTGRTSPTHGEAFIFGKSVRSEMASLQDVMGLCPQDDLLWEELSARQHVALYARFKGVPEAQLDAHVVERLSLVSLLDVGDQLCTTFSGGMKRRLSVALATCGDPQLIFLDEPTTGLDPLSRAQVHRMIERLKANGRVLLLTTHSLTEADALGDTVAILDGGRLRAFGTPLFLKSRFGSGYSINLCVSDPSRVGELRALVGEHLPGAELIADDAPGAAEAGQGEEGGAAHQPATAAGAPAGTSAGPYAALAGGAPPAEGNVLGSRQASGVLTVGVPRALTRAIPAFLRILQHRMQSNAAAGGAPAGGAPASPEPEGGLVREFSVSNSTLEEVFLRLCASKGVNAVVDAGVAPGASPASASGAMMLPGAPGGWFPGGGLQQAARTCVLCECAPTEDVTLFTSAQVAVTSGDLICGACASRSPEQIAEARAAAAKNAALATAPPAPLASQSASDVSSPGVAGNAVEGDDVSKALHERLLGGDNSSSSGEGDATGPGGPVAAKKRGDEGFLEPVSFWRQFFAVLTLRARLQSKQRAANICNLLFVIVAVVLTVLLQPASSVPTGKRCPGGYFSPSFDARGSLCYEGNYSEFLLRPSTSPTNMPEAGAAATERVRNRRHARRAASASTASGGPTSGLGDALRQPAVRLFSQTCLEYDLNGNCVTPGQWPVVPDWRQAISYVPSGNALPYGLSPGAGVFYTDVPGAGSGGNSESYPLGSWDLIGRGPGVLNQSAAQYAYFLDVGYLYNVTGGADGVDAKFTADQRRVFTNSGPNMPYPCYYYGTWSQQGYSGWFTNASDAIVWSTLHMPSFGLGVSDATLPRNVSASGGPSFSYDLRTWALQAGSAFQPGRGNDYFWTRVYFAGGSSSSSCYWSFPILYDDDFWPGPSSGSYAPYQPVPAAMSGLHGAYLRNALLRAGVLTPEEVTPEHPHIRTSLMQYVPLQWFAAAGGTTSSVQPLLFPLFTLFLLPPLAYPVGAEKRDRLYSMISMSGGRRAPYIAAHYAFSVIMFLGVALVYMVAGYVSGAASFTNTGPALLTALMLTWAHAQAGWALLLGAGLPSPRAATILAYLAVVCVAVANFLCTMFLSPWPTSLTWVPVLSYARAATLILSYGGAWVTDGSETQLALLVTLLQGTLALGLGAYLHAVVPGPDGTGTAESWLAPLEPAWRLLRRALGKRDDHHEIHDWAAGAPPSSGSADPDVRAEEARVAAGGSRLAASSAIYLSSVVKEFRVRGGKARQAVRALPPDAGALSRWWARLSANAQEWAWDIAAALMLRPAGASSPSHHVLKRAVDNLSLAVPRGQTLGLLGPNGAGKSTTSELTTAVPWAWSTQRLPTRSTR